MKTLIQHYRNLLKLHVDSNDLQLLTDYINTLLEVNSQINWGYYYEKSIN
jgi:hypothetical protein